MELPRIVYNEVARDVNRREIGIIIGPRQVGKTTILKQLSRRLKQHKTKYRYFDLEMPADANYFARDFSDIISDMGNDKQVILIDEFHYLPNATRLFKVIYDGLKRIKVYASGSSAIEMHKHLKESLAGRRRLYRVYPLSFSEWLPAKSTGIGLPRDITLKLRRGTHDKLKKYLKEFIIFGGMPGLVNERSKEAKKRLLLDLVATYIQKDIKALLREEDILSFNRLLSLLAGQDGGLLSENSISQDLNYSLRQVRKDLAILNQMFLLDMVRPFFTNRTRELRQTYKTYYFDTGIRNAVLNDFRNIDDRPDKGILLESFVLHELQKSLRVSQEIYHWRTREKDEVDFILVQDRIPVAIEVKSRISEPGVPDGVKQFFKKYPECRHAVVLNADFTGEKKYEHRKVIFAPHYYACLIPGLYK